MKKAIVLLLALAVIGGAVFAQVTVNGYVNAGMMMVNNSAGTTFSTYSDDWTGGAGNVGFVNLSYKGEKSGFQFRLVAYDSATDTIDIGDSWGWVSPVAGLKLLGGLSYGGDFDGVDDDSNDYYDVEGVSAIYSVAGFSVGAGMKLAFAGAEAGDYMFGVAYAQDGLVKVRLNAQTLANELNKMSVSASLLAVPGLTFTAGYLSEGMATTANSWIDATVGYAITDMLSAQVVAYDYLDLEYFNIAPRVTYKLSDALSVYGQVAVLTEGANAVTNYATIKPRVRMTWQADAVSKIYGQFEYDTEAEVAKLMLQYVFYF
jgi:hypothetical protein